MVGIIEIGGAIISRASERMEVSGQNIANATTPGYRAQHVFSDLVDGAPIAPDDMRGATRSYDLTPGKLVESGNPFDLALAGGGFFTLRSPSGISYSRNGQFSRDADGRLVTAAGMALQSASGDVVVGTGPVTILSDGTVLDNGQPVARLAVVETDDPRGLGISGDRLFDAPPERMRAVPNPQVHQGMLEASNVSTADEMLALMASLRSAETGQRVVQTYDDLMGRVITAFGQ